MSMMHDVGVRIEDVNVLKVALGVIEVSVIRGDGIEVSQTSS